MILKESKEILFTTPGQYNEVKEKLFKEGWTEAKSYLFSGAVIGKFIRKN